MAPKTDTEATVLESDYNGRPTAFDRPVEWALSIMGADGETREYTLDHTYRTESAAVSEAEDIADQVYQEDDLGWNIGPANYYGDNGDGNRQSHTKK